MKKLDDLVITVTYARSRLVSSQYLRVFRGEKNLDTRIHSGARGVMESVEGKIAIFLQLFP